MRTSPVHYIAPSAISIVPNCNGSANDLAVSISRGTKIKAYSPRAGIDKTGNGEYRGWTLTGRNRRLANSNVPYTIYARLNTLNNTAYLIFAPMTPQEGGEYMSAWTQAYSWITTDGLYVFGKGTDWEEQRTKTNCIFVRLGDVSLPDDNNQRTVTLDTGILGTDQFNDEWVLRPDELPLRIELGCTIGDEDAGPTPYVYWGQSIVLTAMLTEGWTGTDIQRFEHWEIIRNSGDAAADNAWNYQQAAGQGTLSPRLMPGGQITLNHARGVGDDFNGAVSVTFTILAIGHNTETLQREILKTAAINVMAETVEKYELSLSESIVSYDPQTQTYSPTGGVDVGIRATDQRGEVFNMTRGQIANASLVAEYSSVDSSQWTALTFIGSSQEVAMANIATTAFALQQSVNVRLVRRITADGQTVAEKELSRATIAFVRNGEDSKAREWIYTRRASATTFNGATGVNALPSLIVVGEVKPSGVADGDEAYDNKLDEWVPNGWTDDPQGTDSNMSYEYGSYRDYISEFDENNNEGGHWGSFSEPRIWNHYGKDGTITQRRYRSTNSSTYTEPFPQTEDAPAGWGAIGIPTQITTTARYRWVIERYSTDGGNSWSRWSEPVIDAYLAENGTSVRINGEARGHYTTFAALNSARQDGTITPDLGSLYILDTSSDYEEYDEIEEQYIYGFEGPTVMRFVSSPSGNDWEPAQADIGDGYLLDAELWMAQQSGWKNLGSIKGPKGDDAVTYDIVFTEAWAKATPEGVITARLRGFAYRIEGTKRSLMKGATIRYGYNTQNPDTYADTRTENDGSFDEDNWFDEDTLDGYAQGSAVVFVSIIVNGSAVCTKNVTIIKEAADGKAGAAGHTGRFFYYDGTYNPNNIYRINETQAPYVQFTGPDDNEVEQTGFFMLDNGGKEPPYKDWPTDGHPTAPTFKTGVATPWTQMQSTHQYYIAHAFFGKNAYLGSFIINGDWMISQYGTLYAQNGTPYTIDDTGTGQGFNKDNAYTMFNPSYPMTSDPNGINFCPNFAVDGLTGKTYQNDAYIRGEVHATSGDFKNVKISGGMRSPFTYITPDSTFNNDFSDNLAIYSTAANKDENDEVIPTSYNIPWDSSQSGRRIIVANYKWGNGTQVHDGYVKINAPAGKYFFEDGIQKSSIYMSREVIELVGYGDSSNFYGWIVLTRTDLGTNNRYGHNIKALAMGVVNIAGTGNADMYGSYITFDKSSLSLVRNGVGRYTITFGNTNWFEYDEDVFVIVTGCGSTVEGGTPVYANLNSKNKYGFTVYTGYGDILNDGSFNFIVMNFSDWSSIVKNN